MEKLIGKLMLVIAAIIVVVGISFFGKAAEAHELKAKNEKERELILSMDTRMVKFEKIMEYLDEYYPNRTMGEEIELLKKFEPAVIVDNGGCTIEVIPELLEETIPEVKGTITKIETPKIVQDMQQELQTPKVSYTMDDVYLLGDVMYIEAMEYTDDINGELCLKAVGSVVINRANEKQGFYPDTIYGVIHDGEGTKHRQYAGGTLKKIGYVDTPEKVYQWAEELLRDGPIGPANLVFEDNLIHGDIWLQYGKLYFCTSPKISAN